MSALVLAGALAALAPAARDAWRRSFPDGALWALAEAAASSRAAGGTSGFLFDLLGNRELPLEVRWRLARHDSPAVRAIVAGHPNTPAEIIAELRQDEAPEAARPCPSRRASGPPVGPPRRPVERRVAP